MTSHGRHLTESEFVDLFDGTLAPVRRQHVESCAACAAQAADLAMSAQGVEQADVPEPPPFFWTQFSARVGEAVSNEAARPRIGRSWWARRRGLPRRPASPSLSWPSSRCGTLRKTHRLPHLLP